MKYYIKADGRQLYHCLNIALQNGMDFFVQAKNQCWLPARIAQDELMKFNGQLSDGPSYVVIGDTTDIDLIKIATGIEIAPEAIRSNKYGVCKKP